MAIFLVAVIKPVSTHLSSIFKKSLKKCKSGDIIKDPLGKKGDILEEIDISEKNRVMKHYANFIENQSRGYEIIFELIGFAVNTMKEQHIIDKNVSVTGRIKSFESVYNNIGKKNLDDYFGVRIIANKDDLLTIEKQLNQIFVVDQIKDHRKRYNTPYNAVHEMVHLNPNYINEIHPIIDNVFPSIEIQYWNTKIEKQYLDGELSYLKYKHKKLEQIENEYRENPVKLYETMPEYYVIDGKNIKKLSAEETLFKIYPELGNSISVSEI